MATKHYCDVCEKEKPANLLSEVRFGPFLGETHTGLVADICKKCQGEIKKPFKQFRTTVRVCVEAASDE